MTASPMSAAATSCSRAGAARPAGTDRKPATGPVFFIPMASSSLSAFGHHSGRYLAIDGARIYCEEQGPADAPPLLLLHGGLGSLDGFNRLLPQLQGRFRVIGMDTRGHGASTMGGQALTYRRLQADAEGVADQLGLARYSVLGFSDGGVTGLRLAAAPQSRVDKLVVIGVDWKLAADDPLRKTLSGVTAQSWEAKFPGTRKAYEERNPEPDFEAFVKANVALWLDEGGGNYPDDSIRNIRCELLVVRGDADRLTSRALQVELCEAVAGAHMLSIPFAGHEAHEDAMETVMRSVNRFLQPRTGKRPAA
ncbi:MAG: alpha/beta fold hydrolase [Haliea sp.]|nr:MAG: alpha/beta fold hydrolase [Haliea sp.]